MSCHSLSSGNPIFFFSTTPPTPHPPSLIFSFSFLFEISFQANLAYMRQILQHKIDRKKTTPPNLSFFFFRLLFFSFFLWDPSERASNRFGQWTHKSCDSFALSPIRRRIEAVSLWKRRPGMDWVSKCPRYLPFFSALPSRCQQKAESW